MFDLFTSDVIIDKFTKYQNKKNEILDYFKNEGFIINPVTKYGTISCINKFYDLCGCIWIQFIDSPYYRDIDNGVCLSGNGVFKFYSMWYTPPRMELIFDDDNSNFDFNLYYDKLFQIKEDFNKYKVYINNMLSEVWN